MTLLDRHIEQTPGTRCGRPRVAGTRITVDDLAIMHLHLGQPLDPIPGTYNLSLAAVHAAMAYYFDHKPEIDSQIAAAAAFVDAFKRNNPSKLQDRLRDLNRA